MITEIAQFVTKPYIFFPLLLMQIYLVYLLIKIICNSKPNKPKKEHKQNELDDYTIWKMGDEYLGANTEVYNALLDNKPINPNQVQHFKKFTNIIEVEKYVKANFTLNSVTVIY